jgi:hypothetical protein
MECGTFPTEIFRIGVDSGYTARGMVLCMDMENKL